MSIEWEDGAVCFAGGLQFAAPEDGFYPAIGGGAATAGYFNRADFQLNEIREGDYIEASELDTEQKYSDAVDAFGLFGFARSGEFALTYRAFLSHKVENALICDSKLLMGINTASSYCNRKLTYPQLMAIGKLKRAMIEREKAPLDVSGFNTVEQSREKRARRNKSKQAYGILKSLDYEYDLVKQQWYKKQYV